ncbi:MAG: beta-ketoacyl-ACP synthase II [Candidatus Aureabacteria bacterium]|nr:beta-ketoacyl-ACP synthase II [Candidatus Auribacterota bacterium]
MKKRVVITGLGPVSPIGIGKNAFWESLINGRSGITKITSFDVADYPTQIAGEVKNFNPSDFIAKGHARYAGRFSKLAVAAARIAFEDAGLSKKGIDIARIGVAFGTSSMGSGDIWVQANQSHAKGLNSISPYVNSEYTPHIATSHICIELGIKGVNTTISSGCSTSLDALAWGSDRILNGDADVIIAGGTDAPIFPLTFGTFCAMNILSTRNDRPEKASRPFDRDSDGIALSEGAAALVLESYESAIDRGAPIYAEVIAHASSSEAKSILGVEENGETLSHAIRQALAIAGLNGDIDYINAHGNSLPSYDLYETRAFKKAFGNKAYHIPISSIKSMMGHSLASAAGFQLIATCLAIKHCIIPPTINLDHAAVECDLDYTPHQARFNRIRYALLNSHSVGGTHSVLIIGKA